MNFLTHESKEQKNKTIKLNTTKKRLSEIIGVQRTSLSRELTKMRKDNLINFTKDTITIKFDIK
ncbi:MAG: helix-turn-helix domain-containing protein [Christensenellales bacterium]